MWDPQKENERKRNLYESLKDAVEIDNNNNMFIYIYIFNNFGQRNQRYLRSAYTRFLLNLNFQNGGRR